MKKFLVPLAIFGIGQFVIVTSCNKQPTAPSPITPPPGTVTTLAGPSFSLTSGGLSASFNLPTSVAVDDTGNVYVADLGNNMIRKITPSGVVSTVAGNGSRGFFNGTALQSEFAGPRGVAIDKSGNIYVADAGNNMIRMISPAGVVSTLAGTGVTGFANGPGLNAVFSEPADVAVDDSGNVYVADLKNAMIRMISPAGVVSTLAGTGEPGSANGPGSTATFTTPSGVAVDHSGNVYVADYTTYLIRKINSSGVVSTLAGNGIDGDTNGPDSAASFGSPFGVAVDASGNVYVSEIGNQDVRMISASAVVSTLAGSGAVGSHNGISTNASFWFPSGVAVDVAGNVYVADQSNNLIREINRSGYVTTLAGSGSPGAGNSTSVTASFNNPTGVAVDGQNNLYVADYENNVIRKIDSMGVVTTFAGNGTQGSGNGLALSASFYSPYGIAVDGIGNVYVSEIGNEDIRIISPSGVVSTLAGGQPGNSNGTGAAASFNNPTGVAVDAAGNVYVADNLNSMIRKITPGGVVSTLAGGHGLPGATNGPVAGATFNNPSSVAVDASGNVYVADAANNLIRQISATGTVITFAGSGLTGSSDGNVGASFNYPTGVAVDVAGNVYVADKGNNKIRLISNYQQVSTLAGNGNPGSANGIGSGATFNQPFGLAVNAHGVIFVADMGNNLIRQVVQAP
jgi:sugar lactone lactonase YvrE